jgi:hypothetical protein
MRDIVLYLKYVRETEVSRFKEYNKIKIVMSGHRKFIKMWSRAVGMPIGDTDKDKPEFQPITQLDVKKALALRTFWIVLHVLTCVAIIAGNGRVLNFW